jgi:hypothetical protein
MYVCAGDAASLSQENRALKAQLERLMAEGKELRSKVQPAFSHCPMVVPVLRCAACFDALLSVWLLIPAVPACRPSHAIHPGFRP